MATRNLSEYNASQVPDASNMIFGVVVAEWNPEITGALLDGCVSTLEKHGALPGTCASNRQLQYPEHWERGRLASRMYHTCFPNQ